LAVKPKALILHASGSNRDGDVKLALELAGAQAEIVHINQLAKECRMSEYQMLVVPGGFSYGDDLGAGKLWALMLKEKFGEDLFSFVESGKPVIGICNGFQVLVKAGILPGGEQQTATLTYNQSGHFECRWVWLEPNSHSACLWTRNLSEPIYCPVAHGEGRLVAEGQPLASLEARQLVALRYVNPGGAVGYPANPNGSVNHIAGLSNPGGNVLGLMPHPENHIHFWQHPQWRRGLGGHLGLRLFEQGVRAC
jgi:phosphoribosylformylglycinamidine synthase